MFNLRNIKKIKNIIQKLTKKKRDTEQEKEKNKFPTFFPIYDEFVKLKWIIGTTIFIIVRTLVVSFTDMDLLARAAIIVATLVLLIYWLKNWDYHVEKPGTE